jgi:hypothetical protein
MAYLILNRNDTCDEPENEILYEFDSENAAVLREILALLPRRKSGGEKVKKQLIELCQKSMEHKESYPL